MYERTLIDPNKPDWAGRAPSYRTVMEREKALQKVESAYLGPWCPNCGKKGTECKGRAVKGCKARALKNAVRGCKAFGHTLPVPPEDWRVARGYASIHHGRFYGRTNTYDVQMRQHYAYELAMGRANVESSELAA